MIFLEKNKQLTNIDSPLKGAHSKDVFSEAFKLLDCYDNK